MSTGDLSNFKFIFRVCEPVALLASLEAGKALIQEVK